MKNSQTYTFLSDCILIHVCSNYVSFVFLSLPKSKVKRMYVVGPACLHTSMHAGMPPDQKLTMPAVYMTLYVKTLLYA